MKKAIAILLAVMMMFAFAACNQAETGETGKSLEGQTLMIFSGAGLSNPVQEIVDNFMKATGCDVQTVYAGTSQLISQIQTTSEGDILFAGAKDELSLMKDDEATEVVDLVKHIPVLAVQAGNPKGITKVADLAADGMDVLIPNPETTPIGKVAVKAFENAGVKDKVMVSATVTTGPAAITALDQKEADAAIVWKENTKGFEGVEIIDAAEMEQLIKVVPYIELKYSANEEAREAFQEYLLSDEAFAIWQSHGYELAE